MVKVRFSSQRIDHAHRVPAVTAPLTERERAVLEAVIETYVQTAEPAGSRTIAKRHQLGLSPATIRNTMSDLEEKGYLYHPHTSAGRIPTDLAYRVYVDYLMRPPAVAPAQAQHLRGELEGQRAAVETILSRAAQVLGVLTNELGVAVTPTIDAAVLDRLDLLQVSTERLLLVLALRSGAVRTIFVEVPAQLAPESVQKVTVVLNERLAGLTLKEIRATLADRLRDATPSEPGSSELLNIFVQEAEGLFDVPISPSPSDPVHLGSTQLLAGQPEFSTREQLQGLLEVTERRDLLRDALTARGGEGLTITIGQEHADALRGPDKRGAYDRYGMGGVRVQGGGGGFSSMQFDLSEALMVFMRDFGLGGSGGSAFESLFGGGPRRDRRRGHDIKVGLKLTLAEVASGSTKTVRIKSLEPCPECSGTGATPGTQPVRCGTCGGSGEVRHQAQSLFGQFLTVSPCPTCAGEGTVVPSPCPRCGGDGRVTGETTIQIDVPAGVADPPYLSLGGLRGPGPRTCPPRDLTVRS